MKIYTVEQGGYEEHSIIAFYMNKDDAIAHLNRIYDNLKIILRNNYDKTPEEYRDDTMLELEFKYSDFKKTKVISTHFYCYYVSEYEEGKIYENLYDC